MNINNISDIEKYITSSRDIIKNQLSEYFKEYMQLDDIEIRKSSLLGYLVQVLSILVSNQIFYSTMIYRESTLINAKLVESINDWALYLGYKPRLAETAFVDVLFQINLNDTNEFNIVIDKNFKCFADDIVFTNEHKCEIINTLGGIQIFLDTDYGKVTIPFTYDAESKILSFMLTLRQYIIKENNFLISQDLKQYQFYTQDVPISEENYLYDLDVYVDNELWTKYNNLFEMNSDTKGYVYNFSDNSINITFGNGLFGKQPKAGTNLTVFTKETAGKKGNIISGSVSKGDRLFKKVGNTFINFSYFVTNPSPGYNGKDQEDPQETKSNAIINLEALNRLVSENDFKNINKIIPIFGEHVKSILKRSDLKCNEILLYNVLEFFIDNYVPTISHYYTIHRTINKIKPFNIFNFNNKYFYCPFEIIPDYDTYEVNYIYYSRNVFLPLDIQKLNIEIMPFSIDNLNVNSDFDNEKFFIKLNINNINTSLNISNYNVKIVLTNNGNYKKTLNLSLDVNNLNYFYELDFSDLPTGYLNGKLLIDKIDTDENIAEYSFLLNIKIDLYNYTRSQMKKSDETCSELPYDNRFTIFDIPLIEKEWFDNLYIDPNNNVDLRDDFEKRLIQNLIKNLDETDIRLCNSYVSNKFCNTIGELTNIELNIPNYKVKDNVESYSDLLVKYGNNLSSFFYNDMFLINGDLLSDNTKTKYIQINDINDKFYNQETKIAKFIKIDSSGEPVWEFIQPINSDCVYIESKNLKLFFDGNEWFRPHFETPISINIIAYLDDFNLPYGEYIREELYNWLKNNYFGIEKNIYRSEIIRFVQSFSNVIYCKLLDPKIDITFNYDIDNIKHTELLKYTPQFVYFKKELINVKVLPSNRL